MTYHFVHSSSKLFSLSTFLFLITLSLLYHWLSESFIKKTISLAENLAVKAKKAAELKENLSLYERSNLSNVTLNSLWWLWVNIWTAVPQLLSPGLELVDHNQLLQEDHFKRWEMVFLESLNHRETVPYRCLSWLTQLPVHLLTPPDFIDKLALEHVHIWVQLWGKNRETNGVAYIWLEAELLLQSSGWTTFWSFSLSRRPEAVPGVGPQLSSGVLLANVQHTSAAEGVSHGERDYRKFRTTSTVA